MSCNQNASLCHQNADCIFNNRLREHECVCSFNYFGDGINCRPLEKHVDEHIIFGQGMSLLNLSITDNKRNGRLLLTKEGQTPVGLDVDCLEGYVYWADLTNKAIHRAPYNGSWSDTILQGENESPGRSFVFKMSAIQMNRISIITQFYPIKRESQSILYQETSTGPMHNVT